MTRRRRGGADLQFYSFFNLGARWYLGINGRIFCTLFVRKLSSEHVDCIYLPQVTIQWSVFVNAVTNFCFTVLVIYTKINCIRICNILQIVTCARLSKSGRKSKWEKKNLWSHLYAIKKSLASLIDTALLVMLFTFSMRRKLMSRCHWNTLSWCVRHYPTRMANCVGKPVHFC